MTPATQTRHSHRRPRQTATVLICALAAAQVLGWFTASPRVGHFRTVDDRLAYEAAYTRAMALMPSPSRTLDVQTAFGTVRVYEWANPDATGAPVVLLPGRGSGVPMWSQNLPSLLAQRSIYALDALGDAGLSAQSAPLTSTVDQASWIDETLKALEIERAHIVGHSFGAASAMALAVNRPARLASLTLLEPAFVLRWPPASIILWSIPASLPFLPQTWRNAAIAQIAGEDPGAIDPDDPVATMITLGGTGYSAALPTPHPLTDVQLRSITVATYVALADGSPITKGAASRAKAELIPDVQVKVWPGTTHSLPMQVADPLAAELAVFWSTHDT